MTLKTCQNNSTLSSSPLHFKVNVTFTPYVARRLRRQLLLFCSFGIFQGHPPVNYSSKKCFYYSAAVWWWSRGASVSKWKTTNNNFKNVIFRFLRQNAGSTTKALPLMGWWFISPWLCYCYLLNASVDILTLLEKWPFYGVLHSFNSLIRIMHSPFFKMRSAHKIQDNCIKLQLNIN